MLDRSRKTIIPFVMAGFPSIEVSENLILGLVQVGCDVIEVGVPFSDPLADGPSIQMAAEAALKNGASLEAVLAMCRRVNDQAPQAKLVLFTYLNPLLKYGLEKLAMHAKAAGVSAILTVDLPVEEAGEYMQILAKNNLKTVFLVSPSTTTERAREIAKHATGFVYYVSRLGVTGAKSELSQTLGDEVARLRQVTDKAIAVGFGISTAEQASRACAIGDAAVIGSQFINILREKSEAAAVKFADDCLNALK